MNEPIGYVNGRYVPASAVMLPITDPGFAWGAVVTDRLRTFNGQAFRVEEHLRRLRTSCELARIQQPRPDAELDAVIRRVVQENWTRVELSVICLAAPGPNLIVYTQPIDRERVDRIRQSGARLVSARATEDVDPRIKHRSRLSWWIASEQVRTSDPHAEPLFVDPSGHVLETPTANLLAVLDGVVTSPPAGSVLPGVSLAVAREICASAGIPFTERPIRLPELKGDSELLLTNTTYCVGGVSFLDDRPMPFPGAILNRLLDAWSELVGVNLRPAYWC